MSKYGKQKLGALTATPSSSGGSGVSVMEKNV